MGRDGAQGGAPEVKDHHGVPEAEAGVQGVPRAVGGLGRASPTPSRPQGPPEASACSEVRGLEPKGYAFGNPNLYPHRGLGTEGPAKYGYQEGQSEKEP
ncbi:hypothetical protein YIM1640_12520 [Thermus oshimai]